MAGRKRKPAVGNSIRVGTVLAMTTLGAAIQASAQTRKVFCMGASICQGVGADSPYPERLGRLLGNGYDVRNGGRSGSTLLRKGDRPWWIHLPGLFAYKPDIVLIELGGNDSKPMNWHYESDFGPDLAAMFDTLRSMTPKPLIYACLPVPAFGNGSIRGPVIRDEIIPIMREVAPRHGVPLIDLNTPLSGFSAHFPDGVHPDDVVHDTISHLIHRALRSPTAVLAREGRIIPLDPRRPRWIHSGHGLTGNGAEGLPEALGRILEPSPQAGIVYPR